MPGASPLQEEIPMAKSRKPEEQPAPSPDQNLPAAGQSPQSENAADTAPAAPEPSTGGKLAQAEEKLARMQETNKICFRHQNDFAAIEQELKERFHYSDSELEHILEPKGQRMIPGFGYSEMERQKQYVSYLKRNATQRGGSHVDQVESSREEGQGPTR